MIRTKNGSNSTEKENVAIHGKTKWLFIMNISTIFTSVYRHLKMALPSVILSDFVLSHCASRTIRPEFLLLIFQFLDFRISASSKVRSN